jgi:hypothetical protein
MHASIGEELQQTVDRATAQLLRFSDRETSLAPAPGKWSKKEIIGHLIDSAAVNHARFVKAQSSSDLLFEGYDQEEWVRLQRYRERSWEELVKLWHAYNHHLASVMAAADESARMRPRIRHSLDSIAFKVVASDQPTTLEYLMIDYVDHLEHHLRQIFGDKPSALSPDQF